MKKPVLVIMAKQEWEAVMADLNRSIQLIKRDTSLWIFPCLMQKEPDLRRLFLL